MRGPSQGQLLEKESKLQGMGSYGLAEVTVRGAKCMGTSGDLLRGQVLI